MSANINFDQNKASHISTGSSGLEIAVIAGIKLLRIARLGSPLGIAGFILPLVLIKNCRLIHFVLAAAEARAAVAGEVVKVVVVVAGVAVGETAG